MVSAFCRALPVESVGPDGRHIGAVPGGPASGGHGGIHKVQGAARSVGTVQAQLGGNHALSAGGTVDASVSGGGELVALKDHLVDAVGEPGAGHPVEHHITHCNLSVQGLIAALSIDDAGEPVHHVRLVGLLTGEEGPAAGGDLDGGLGSVPLHAGAQRLAQGSDGNHDAVALALDSVRHVQVAAVGLDILGAGLDVEGQAVGLDLCLTIDPLRRRVRIQGAHDGPVGHIGSARLHTVGHICRKGDPIDYKADAALSRRRLPGQGNAKGQADERTKGSFLHA